jgi:hypothetical protein
MAERHVTVQGDNAEFLQAVSVGNESDGSTGDAGVETLVLDLPAPPETFQVNDEASANWVVRKVVEARAYAERVAEWAERERRRAQHEEAFFLMRYGPQLQAWCRSEIAKLKGRRKSLNLPAGCAGFRSAPAKLVIDDEAVVLTWAKAECPKAVVVTEKLSRTELNAHFDRTGEVPDAGAHVQDAQDNFYIR